jgi:DNA-binding IclR family transcriptional regulator
VAATGGAPHAQTLDRGLRVLEELAEAERPLRSVRLAEILGVHRSIVYRILRTLEDHGLVRRTDGGWVLGAGLAALARSALPGLDGAATPGLGELANELGMTAFLTVADRDECLTVLTAEPTHSAAHIVYRPGRRHPLDRGGPGIALLAGGPPLPGERPEVTAARAAGYTVTHGEVITGLSSVAAPVVGADGRAVASVAVLYPTGQPQEERIVGCVCRAAAAIGRALR